MFVALMLGLFTLVYCYRILKSLRTVCSLLIVLGNVRYTVAYCLNTNFRRKMFSTSIDPSKIH